MVLVPDFLGPTANIFKRQTFRPRTVKAKPPSESSLPSAEIGRDFDIHIQEMMDWIGKNRCFFFLIWQYVSTLQLLPWKILIVYINEF